MLSISHDKPGSFLFVCRTVAQLPGDAVLLGLTVLDQGPGIAAVPDVVRGAQQGVQTEDEVHLSAVGKGGQEVHRVL